MRITCPHCSGGIYFYTHSAPDPNKEPHKNRKINLAEAKRMRSEGQSTTLIAQHFGVSRQAVDQMLKVYK